MGELYRIKLKNCQEFDGFYCKLVDFTFNL